MLRQIVVPHDTRLVLELPEDYLHQEIEIIAFRIGEGEAAKSVSQEDPLAVFDHYQGRFEGNFNRDELYDR
jgi:hypothetical protein